MIYQVIRQNNHLTCSQCVLALKSQLNILTEFSVLIKTSEKGKKMNYVLLFVLFHFLLHSWLTRLFVQLRLSFKMVHEPTGRMTNQLDHNLNTTQLVAGLS